MMPQLEIRGLSIEFKAGVLKRGNRKARRFV
jgi:hypothetical protein